MILRRRFTSSQEWFFCASLIGFVHLSPGAELQVRSSAADLSRPLMTSPSSETLRFCVWAPGRRSHVCTVTRCVRRAPLVSGRMKRPLCSRVPFKSSAVIKTPWPFFGGARGNGVIYKNTQPGKLVRTVINGKWICCCWVFIFCSKLRFESIDCSVFIALLRFCRSLRVYLRSRSCGGNF